MNRSESRRRWQRIVDGDLDLEQYDGVDLHRWIREVAAKILEADDEPVAVKRPQAITAAVGLAGKEDSHAALRELVEQETMFDAYDEDGTVIVCTEGQTVGRLVAVARARGLIAGSYADDPGSARKLVRSILSKKV